MTLAAKLDALREAVPGCKLAACGDLGARLVLRASSAEPRPQEVLDALCRDAARAFAMQDALGTAAGGGLQATVHALGETRVFLRAGGGGQDAVLCICAPGAETAAIAQAAQDILQGLKEDG